MTSLLINIYSFGLIPVYFNYLRFSLPAGVVGDGTHSSAYRDLHVIFGYKQWSITLAHLRQQWKTACASCAFVATLSLGFLQITDNIPAYTFALAAIISAGSGLINAASNIWLGPDADSLIFMKKWIEASESLDRKGSIAFWISLMSPGISLAW
ncbi:hypothetical protein CVT26_011844 [Gymnopilus dilepis]|uniref:Uncharacterized protein n=1 Tax=Gymnopilus dilepis TaxID=231916 RepID=A0A409X0P0_9AGAR|nr:hypothetical protein CVT26_011844 [Gymnopilus dilepis]